MHIVLPAAGSSLQSSLLLPASSSLQYNDMKLGSFVDHRTCVALLHESRHGHIYTDADTDLPDCIAVIALC